ncbi:MAG: hypothetical protein AAGC60_18780 [Acidobacteriota bacterium]
MRRVRAIAVAFLAIVCLPAFSKAQADIQVNTYTTSSQYKPSVAADSDGNFVVVWASLGSDDTDSDGFSIQGQRFTANGSMAGAQFQVNTYTTSDQRSPTVAMDADGDFTIVWTSDGSADTDSSLSSIQGRRYASDGSAVSAQFQVNTYTTGTQLDPSADLDADGDLVVVWTSFGSDGTDSSSYSIQGRRFASDGSNASDQFQVNSFTTGEQTTASVAMDADGDFVVAWRSAASGGTDTSADSVQGRRFAFDGSPLGDQIQINTFTTSVQTSPSVDLDVDGDFVVAWMSDGSAGSDSDGYSIQGQRFASTGSPQGDQFQINTYTTSLQFNPSVGVDSDGDFVIVWNSFGSDGTDTSGSSIQGRRYSSDGSPVASQFQVNSYTTGFQDDPIVAVDSDGDFVVAWTSSGSDGSDSSGYSIQAATISAQADLVITKTDSQDPVSGNSYSYTLQVTNLGPAIAVSVVATDPLPAGIVFAGSADGCTEAAGTVTCAFGDLAVNASASRSFDVMLDPPFADSVTNTATVSSTSPDPVAGNDAGSETTGLDTVPPQVSNVDTSAPSGDGSLTLCEVVRSQILGLNVDLTDNLSPIQGVTDPSAFLLVSTGPDGAFSTTDCAGGVAGDDVQIQIIDLVLNDTDPLAVASRFGLVSSFGLAPGLYRFLACDTITDSAGNALDGDGDGTAGGDLRIDFRADPFNSFLNGNFDACAGSVTLAPWIATATPPNDVQPSAAGQDASGSPLSGSAEFSHLQDGSSSLAQCVPINGRGTLDLRAQLRFTPAGLDEGILRASCEFFDAPDCGGSSRGLQTSTSILQDTGSMWQPLPGRSFVLPSGARSALCAFILEPMSPMLPSFGLGLDALFLGDSLVFRDGFESGNTSVWTQADP